MYTACAYSHYEAGDPDANEQIVTENSTEHVSFAVHFARVKLVEQSHKHERRKHHRVVYVPFRYLIVIVCIVKVENHRPFMQTHIYTDVTERCHYNTRHIIRCRVCYRALSLRYACTRSAGIILTPSLPLCQISFLWRPPLLS